MINKLSNTPSIAKKSSNDNFNNLIEISMKNIDVKLFKKLTSINFRNIKLTIDKSIDNPSIILYNYNLDYCLINKLKLIGIKNITFKN